MITDINETRLVSGSIRYLDGNTVKVENFPVSLTGYWDGTNWDDNPSHTVSLCLTVKDSQGRLVLGQVFDDLLETLWAEYHAQS